MEDGWLAASGTYLEYAKYEENEALEKTLRI